MVTVADADDAKAGRPSEFLLLVQISILIAVGLGLGELMQRIGQPTVVGELLCGLLLGPSLFGWIWPEAQHAIFPPLPEQKALLDGTRAHGPSVCWGHFFGSGLGTIPGDGGWLLALPRV